MTDAKTVRAALYARCSTNEQDPEVQIHELRQQAARRGWRVADEYVDHGVSGSKTSRPALDRLMADARRGRLDVVAVWALDRFGRSLSGLVMSIDELTSLRVGFVAVTQGIDTSHDNPAGTLTLQVLGAVAAFEKAMIVSRVRAGLAKAKANGKHIGRPKSAIDPDQVRILRESGLSLREIADRVGGSKSAVARLIAG